MSNQSEIKIRLCRDADAAAVLAIYAPFTHCDCAVSFEAHPPSLDEMRMRIMQTLKIHPWIVVEEEDDILGYASAGAFHQRDAYKWSVTSSIYMAQSARGRGLGKVLYGKLFDLLREQGFYNVFGGVTLPNPASEALHKSFGFRHVVTYNKVGFKVGQWQDVAWYQLVLRPHDDSPSQPRAIADIDTERILQINQGIEAR